MSVRGIRLLGAGAAGLALLAGCGSGAAGGPLSPPKISTVADLSTAVSATTSQKGTVRLTMTMDSNATTHVTASGSGVIRFYPQPAGDLTMNIGSPGGASLGQAEAIAVDGAFYMKLPSGFAQNLGRSLGSGSDLTKPWLRFDQNGTDPISRLVSPMLNSAQQYDDPAAMIAKIKAAGTITSTTQEQVDGQPTTHYTIKVDIRQLAATLPDSDPEKRLMNQAGNTGLTSQTVNVWVNSQGLPVRDVITTGQVTATIDYSDWGTPVTVTAPPADQVGTLPGH
jgi:hypothetical protein